MKQHVYFMECSLWFINFVAAVIPVILVSLILMHKWYKGTYKGNSFIKKFLCDKILQLEKIAYKDHPTEEDCLTLQI